MGLEQLLGSKSIEKILLFLLVNGKCYGVELQKALKTPLTPLQKALSRLELGGILTSYYEGKTRLYQFNPGFPLLAELEALIKKAYTLLSSEEKKSYYVMRQDPASQRLNREKKVRILLSFWRRLSAIKHLVFHAKTRAQEEGMGWNGKGRGEVRVTRGEEKSGKKDIWIFTEKGSWRSRESEEIQFSNAFRYTLDLVVGVISLEHLRYGLERPVYLFDLSPTGEDSLSSIDSHLCVDDLYFGRMRLEKECLRLSWRVIGPKKNEELEYYYS